MIGGAERANAIKISFLNTLIIKNKMLYYIVYDFLSLRNKEFYKSIFHFT